MRTIREILADLDAVNDEIMAVHAREQAGVLDHILSPAYYYAPLAARRRRLQAELAEARAADELTPSMFDEARL